MDSVDGLTILKLATVAAIGALLSLGLYALVFADGVSYLADDPETCLNCHAMRPQFEGWNHSSHKAVAVCDDCHTPQAFVGKWAVKAINGWNHSFAFTTGRYPDPIRIRPLNARVAQDNCVRCHATMVSQIHVEAAAGAVSCARCHEHVGHWP